MPIRKIDDLNRTTTEEQPETVAPPEEGIGHNSYGLAQAAKDKLKEFAANIIDCEERAKEISEEKKDHLAKAKAAGFDAGALKAAISFLKNEADKTEAEQIRDLYVEVLRERGV